jgi:hypothetical protein
MLNRNKSLIKNINFFIKLFVFSCLIISLSSCTETQRKDLKHFKSSVVGLKRKVTLYGSNGELIRSWEGRFKIEVIGAYIAFIDDNGKEIKVSGNVVVEEI